MRRLLLLVVGGRVPNESIADWLADPKSHGIAVFQVPERGARLVLVDVDSGIALALRSFDKTKSATRGGSKNVSVKTALVFCAT